MSNVYLPSIAASQNLGADGAYAVQVPVPPALPSGTSSNVIAIIGAFRNGKPNTTIPVAVSSQSGLGPVLAAMGDGVPSGVHLPYDGVREAITATPESVNFCFIRTTDGTDTAATLPLNDLTGFASGTFTGGGTWATAKAITLTLTPTSGSPVVINYTSGTNGDNSIPTTMQQLVNLINSSTAVVAGSLQFMQPATLTGNIITVTALTQGVAGNSIGISTNTPTGFTCVASGANLTGGAAPGVLATITFNTTGTLMNGATGVVTLQSGSLSLNPIYTVSLAAPYNGQQTWRNILGSAVNGAYSNSIFVANLVAAINGTATNQLAYTLGVASAGSSTSSPLLNTTLSASGGTDGATGLTTNTQIGTDGITGRTGIYAMRGQAFGVLILAGLTDPTADAPLQAFLSQVGGIGVTAFPSGTSTSSAQTSKQNYGLSNGRIVRVMDWLYAPDTLANRTNALISPIGGVAGIIASLQPWQDISNKPLGASKGNIFGTERTVSNTAPVDPSTEGTTRKNLGFNYITDGQPRVGGLLGLAHGKASDGSNVADTRMFDYIASQVLAILQRYIGQNQGPPAAVNQLDLDPIRTLIRQDFAALGQTFLNPNNPQLVAFGCQFVGNATQVAAGYCPWSLQGETFSGIQFAIAQIAVGSTITPSADA